MDAAVEDGVPATLDETPLALKDANWIGDVADIVMERNPTMRLTTGINHGVKQFQRTFEPHRDHWRARPFIALTGPDRIVIPARA